jgi:hypothetical protein
MPGALVYTDQDLDDIFCNERFREVYAAPAELPEPGRPYPAFLRFLAENGRGNHPRHRHRLHRGRDGGWWL